MAGRFRPGDRVRASTSRSEGHSRLPGYLRGRRGVVESERGIYPLADDRARGLPVDQCVVEPLYTVVFDGRDVFPDGSGEGVTISADLWDSYLLSDEAP